MLTPSKATAKVLAPVGYAPRSAPSVTRNRMTPELAACTAQMSAPSKAIDCVRPMAWADARTAPLLTSSFCAPPIPPTHMLVPSNARLEGVPGALKVATTAPSAGRTLLTVPRPDLAPHMFSPSTARAYDGENMWVTNSGG